MNLTVDGKSPDISDAVAKKKVLTELFHLGNVVKS